MYSLHTPCHPRHLSQYLLPVTLNAKFSLLLQDTIMIIAIEVVDRVRHEIAPRSADHPLIHHAFRRGRLVEAAKASTPRERNQR